MRLVACSRTPLTAFHCSGVTWQAEARVWIEQMLSTDLGDGDTLEVLQDGVVLCKLACAIQPGIIPPPSTSKMPFKQMENVGSYLKASAMLGVT